MPWKLDYIWGRGSHTPDFGFEADQDSSVVLRQASEIPDDKHLPVRIFQDSKHTKFPDYVTGPTTETLLVSPKFRALVEEWDTGSHTYIPVALRLNSGEVSLDHYSIFVPQEPIENGIVSAESEVREVIRKSGMRYYRPTTQRPRLMWRKSAIGDRHLWMDRGLPNEIVVSDDLYAAMKKSGVFGFQAHESRLSEKEL